MKVAVGIITYNRLDALRQCLAGVHLWTRRPHTLFVADDGSTDGTREWLDENRIPHVSAVNRGLPRNRNRAIYYMMTRTDADAFVLLEDDTVPVEFGWEWPWALAARRWKMVCFGWPPYDYGAGTPESPYVTRLSGTCCMAISREAVARFGYTEPRFKGKYGHDDSEYRYRVARGYGLSRGEFVTPCLRSGSQVRDYVSKRHGASADADMNALTLQAVINEKPHYVDPWCDEAEKSEFLSEQAGAKWA